MMIFSFDEPQTGSTYVTCDIQFLKQNKDYGFLTEENRKSCKELQIVELNHGMEPAFWCQDEVLASLSQDEKGCYIDYEGDGLMPLTFAAKVKEGNYKISATLYAKTKQEVFVFLGRRRLLYHGWLEAGESKQIVGIENVCPIIPRGYDIAMEDETIDVTILGREICLQSINVEPFLGSTIYIAGDSTVTDQSAAYPYYPWNSYCGWGQMLSGFLKEQMAVSNHAHSGLTTESFRAEGHYKILIDRIAPKDICLIQFGHNDQKLMELKAHEGYRDRLIQYIEEIEKKNAIPVLISPIARNSWIGNEKYNDLLEEYAAVCREIADEKRLLFIDLHKYFMDFVIAHGREDAKRFFFPADFTHTNDYGAYLCAGFIFDALAAAGLVAESKYEAWLPQERFPEILIPEKYAKKENLLDVTLLLNIERPEELLTRVEALEFVIQTMKFFPTNVYNDMFLDVIGHETYAGSVECAWQNGLIPDDMVKDKRFYPKKEITGKEFIEILLRGYESRKTLTKEERQKAYSMLSPELFIKRKAAAEICRQMQI